MSNRYSTKKKWKGKKNSGAGASWWNNQDQDYSRPEVSGNDFDNFGQPFVGRGRGTGNFDYFVRPNYTNFGNFRHQWNNDMNYNVFQSSSFGQSMHETDYDWQYSSNNFKLEKEIHKANNIASSEGGSKKYTATQKTPSFMEMRNHGSDSKALNQIDSRNASANQELSSCKRLMDCKTFPEPRSFSGNRSMMASRADSQSVNRKGDSLKTGSHCAAFPKVGNRLEHNEETKNQFFKSDKPRSEVINYSRLPELINGRGNPEITIPGKVQGANTKRSKHKQQMERERMNKQLKQKVTDTGRDNRASASNDQTSSSSSVSSFRFQNTGAKLQQRVTGNILPLGGKYNGQKDTVHKLVSSVSSNQAQGPRLQVETSNNVSSTVPAHQQLTKANNTSNSLSKEDLIKLISSPRSRRDHLRLNRILQAHAEKQKNSIPEPSTCEAEDVETAGEPEIFLTEIDVDTLPPEVQREINRLSKDRENIREDFIHLSDNETSELASHPGSQEGNSGVGPLSGDCHALLNSVQSLNDDQCAVSSCLSDSVQMISNVGALPMASVSENGYAEQSTSCVSINIDSSAIVTSLATISTATTPQATCPSMQVLSVASSASSADIGTENGLQSLGTLLRISLREEEIRGQLKDAEDEVANLERQLSEITEQLTAKKIIKEKLTEEKVQLRTLRLQILRDSIAQQHEVSSVGERPTAVEHSSNMPLQSVSESAPTNSQLHSFQNEHLQPADVGFSFESVLNSGVINIEPVNDEDMENDCGAICSAAECYQYENGPSVGLITIEPTEGSYSSDEEDRAQMTRNLGSSTENVPIVAPVSELSHQQCQGSASQTSSEFETGVPIHMEYVGTLDTANIQPHILEELARNLQAVDSPCVNFCPANVTDFSVQTFPCSDNEIVESHSPAATFVNGERSSEQTGPVQRSQTSVKEPDDCVISRVEKPASRKRKGANIEVNKAGAIAKALPRNVASQKHFTQSLRSSRTDRPTSTSEVSPSAGKGALSRKRTVSTESLLSNSNGRIKRTRQSSQSLTVSKGSASPSAGDSMSAGKSIHQRADKKNTITSTPAVRTLPTESLLACSRTSTPIKATRSVSKSTRLRSTQAATPLQTRCVSSQRNPIQPATQPCRSDSSLVAFGIPSVPAHTVSSQRNSENSVPGTISSENRDQLTSHTVCTSAPGAGNIEAEIAEKGGGNRATVLKSTEDASKKTPPKKKKGIENDVAKNKKKKQRDRSLSVNLYERANPRFLHRHDESVRAIVVANESVITASDCGQIMKVTVPREIYGLFGKQRFIGHQNGVVGLLATEIKTSQDGRNRSVVLSIGRDRVLQMQCVQTGIVLKTQTFDKNFCYDCICESNDTIFMAQEDGSIARVTTSTFAVREPFIVASSSRISALATAVVDQNHLLLIGFGDCTIAVRDAMTNTLIRTLKGHFRAPRYILTLNGSIISSCGDCSVFIHSLKNGDAEPKILHFPSPVVAITAQMRYNLLVVVTRNKTVTCFDFKENVKYFLLLSTIEHPLTCLAVYNNMLLFGCSNGIVHYIDVDMRRHFACRFSECKDRFWLKGDLEDHIKEQHAISNEGILVNGRFKRICSWQGCQVPVAFKKAQAESHFLSHLTELEMEPSFGAN